MISIVKLINMGNNSYIHLLIQLFCSM
jgi:hypothetical protein